MFGEAFRELLSATIWKIDWLRNQTKEHAINFKSNLTRTSKIIDKKLCQPTYRRASSTVWKGFSLSILPPLSSVCQNKLCLYKTRRLVNYGKLLKYWVRQRRERDFLLTVASHSQLPQKRRNILWNNKMRRLISQTKLISGRTAN